MNGLVKLPFPLWNNSTKTPSSFAEKAYFRVRATIKSGKPAGGSDGFNRSEETGDATPPDPRERARKRNFPSGRAFAGLRPEPTRTRYLRLRRLPRGPCQPFGGFAASGSSQEENTPVARAAVGCMSSVSVECGADEPSIKLIRPS